MFYVYAIYSIEKNYIYVDLTSNIEERLKRHNGLKERATKFYAPFKLIYLKEAITRIDARVREKYWKSGIVKEKLRSLRDAN